MKKANKDKTNGSTEGAEVSTCIPDMIAERRRIEEALRESEERYRRMVELSPEMIAIHTAAPEPKWVYMNDAGARVFGAARPEELIGKRVIDFIHPEHHAFIRKRWQRTQVERKPTEPAEIKIVRLDGTIRHVVSRGIPTTYEGNPATQPVLRDIHERKLAEEEIRRLNQVLESRVAERTTQLEATVSKLEANEQMLREREADLQRSREQLVAAREEERRRLRRDLHDGLGPQLASLTLGLDAARNLLANEPKKAETMLAELKAQTQEAIFDIRRLVYDLRPPALDDLGLVSVIRQQAAKYGLPDEQARNSNGLAFSVEAPESLPPLPAAVEVACYRIAQEAITNVARHARARHCRVRLSIEEAENELELEVADDGVGLPDDRHTGVGLSSIRERASELGGTCVIESVSAGGTRVLARLPLPMQEKE